MVAWQCREGRRGCRDEKRIHCSAEYRPLLIKLWMHCLCVWVRVCLFVCVSAGPHIYSITTLPIWGVVRATNKQRDTRGSNMTSIHSSEVTIRTNRNTMRSPSTRKPVCVVCQWCWFLSVMCTLMYRNGLGVSVGSIHVNRSNVGDSF